MMSTPRASFVVTCHNLGAYLEETLDSLDAQSVQDFEVVIVNDGSTDGETCRLLAALERPRTAVVHTERRGLPGARNLGVTHTTGALLAMVDADDLLEPTYLERSLTALDAAPGAAFASHWLRAFGDEHWEWTPADCTVPALLQTNTVNGAALVRREMFERLGGFDETMTDGCEDWEFWIRAVAAGFSGVIVPEFLFRYRRRADSMSRLMEAAPGTPGLLRQIIDRHPEVFLDHLDNLLARADGELAALSTNLWRLDEAWTGEVEGLLAWHDDNRVAAGEAPAAPDWPLQRAREESRRLQEHLQHERALNASLLASWSWRLTAPLRRLLDLVKR